MEYRFLRLSYTYLFVCFNVSLSISNSVNLTYLSLLVNWAKGLLILSQRTSSYSYVFVFFFVSVSLISAQISNISCYLLDLF